MHRALKIINEKKLGVIIIRKNRNTVGIITDGDLKKNCTKYKKFDNLEIKKVMKKILLV